jgi:hypothetical protein
MLQTFYEKQLLNDSATRLFVKELMQFQMFMFSDLSCGETFIQPSNHPKPVKKVKVFRTLHNQQPQVENT